MSGSGSVFLVAWVLFGILTAFVASAKNRSVGLWALLGFLFGVLALIVIAVMPSKKPAYYY